MGQGRRDFLRAIGMVPVTATAAIAVVKERGGELNLSDEPARLPAPYTGRYGHDACNYAVDIRDHGLYDCLRIPAGTEVRDYLPMFCNPIGYNRPGSWEFKTYADTNVYRANSLCPPEIQRVERIAFLINPAAHPDDINQLCSSYYWEFTLGQKIMARAPIARKPVFGDIADLFYNRRPESQGDPAGGKRKELKLPKEMAIHLKNPVTIESLMHYSFDLHGKPFVTRNQLELYVVLDGTGVFAIQ